MRVNSLCEEVGGVTSTVEITPKRSRVGLTDIYGLSNTLFTLLIHVLSRLLSSFKQGLALITLYKMHGWLRNDGLWTSLLHTYVFQSIVIWYFLKRWGVRLYSFLGNLRFASGGFTTNRALQAGEMRFECTKAYGRLLDGVFCQTHSSLGTAHIGYVIKPCVIKYWLKFSMPCPGLETVPHYLMGSEGSVI